MRCNKRRGVQEEEAPAVGGENGGLEAELPDGYFEVEAIIKKRMKKEKAEYLVKWVGWPESANTWEPYEHLEGCAEAVEAFEKRTQQGRRKSVRPTTTLHEEETNGGINPSNHEEETNGKINLSDHEEETNGRINPSDNGNHDDPDIVKIIRLVRTEVSNDKLLVTFAVLRSDGKEVMADNRYLKLLYPQLLINYYERRLPSTITPGPSDDQEHVNEV